MDVQKWTQSFINIAESLLEHRTLDSVFDTITKTACSFFNASASSIMLFDKEKEYLRIVHSINLSPEYLKAVKVRRGEEIAGKVCEDRKPRFVPDVLQLFKNINDKFTVEWVKKEGLCTLMTAPLLLRDEPIGCLNIYYRSPKESFEDLTALDFFTKLAALSIEHTRLIDETEEKTKIVTSIEEIGVVLTSTFDIEKIMMILLSTAVSLTKTDAGSLVLVDEKTLNVLGAYDYFRDENVIKKYKTTARLNEGISGEVIRTKKPVIIPDLSQYQDINPTAVKKGRVSIIGAPLIAREKLIGILYVDSYSPRDFTKTEVDYLLLLCNQAAIALDNTLLYKKISREAMETAILYEVSRTFISTLDFDVLLTNILKRLIVTFGYLNLAIFLVDDENQILRLCSYINYPDTARDLKLRIGEDGITGHVAAIRETYYAPDVSSDPFYIKGIAEARSEVCFPLMIGERLIGVLDVESPEIDGFTNDDIRILSTLSAQIAITLDNARLYAETKNMSLTDPLTTLPNRRSFEIFINGEIKRAERYRRPFALMMIDFDNFKKYNDKYGHSAGDYIIQRFSKRMKESIRDVDFLGRYGGDEFISVLTETDANFALGVADRMRRKIETEHLDPYITLSIGIAIFPRDTRDKTTLVNLADQACYDAKQMGGNRVTFAGVVDV